MLVGGGRLVYDRVTPCLGVARRLTDGGDDRRGSPSPEVQTMLHLSPTVRSRARAPVLLALFCTAIWFAACTDDPTAPRARRLVANGAAIIDPNSIPLQPHPYWDPPTPCDIGNLSGGASFFGLFFPVRDTVCGVQWEAWTPQIFPTSEWALMFH